MLAMEGAEYEDENPVCERLPGLDGCGVYYPGLGMDPAIDVFFRVMTVYLNPNQWRWEYMSMFFKIAAHDLFAYYNGPGGGCSDAVAQQETLQKAFNAVGHPGYYSDTFICTYCGCNQ